MGKTVIARSVTDGGAPPKTQPLLSRAPTLAQRIYADLLQDIVMDRFDDGQKLPSEAELSNRYGVSRPVLREALARLKEEGLVVARQGAGNFFRKPHSITLQAGTNLDLGDVIRGLEYRMALEPEAAYWAALRRSSYDMQEITEANEKFERVTSANEVGINSDFRFHLAIAAASHNDLFVSGLFQIHKTISHELNVLNLGSLKSAERKIQVRDEHRKILDAIKDGDATAAASIARKHVEAARDRIVRIAKSGRAPEKDSLISEPDSSNKI